PSPPPLHPAPTSAHITIATGNRTRDMQPLSHLTGQGAGTDAGRGASTGRPPTLATPEIVPGVVGVSM
ncbi:MAG: hypothetical protein ABIJ75_12030, partial [Actinomycetota bacterium]